jgi:hypothetical protein
MLCRSTAVESVVVSRPTPNAAMTELEDMKVVPDTVTEVAVVLDDTLQDDTSAVVRTPTIRLPYNFPMPIPPIAELEIPSLFMEPDAVLVEVAVLPSM